MYIYMLIRIYYNGTVVHGIQQTRPLSHTPLFTYVIHWSHVIH